MFGEGSGKYRFQVGWPLLGADMAAVLMPELSHKTWIAGEVAVPVAEIAC